MSTQSDGGCEEIDDVRSPEVAHRIGDSTYVLDWILGFSKAHAQLGGRLAESAEWDPDRIRDAILQDFGLAAACLVNSALAVELAMKAVILKTSPRVRVGSSIRLPDLEISRLQKNHFRKHPLPLLWNLLPDWAREGAALFYATALKKLGYPASGPDVLVLTIAMEPSESPTASREAPDGVGLGGFIDRNPSTFEKSRYLFEIRSDGNPVTLEFDYIGFKLAHDAFLMVYGMFQRLEAIVRDSTDGVFDIDTSEFSLQDSKLAWSSGRLRLTVEMVEPLVQ